MSKYLDLPFYSQEIFLNTVLPLLGTVVTDDITVFA